MGTTAAASAQTVPLDSLEARAARDSMDAIAWYELALGCLRRERYNQADTVLRRAVALDPQYAEAHLALAVAQERNRRFWDALRRRGDTAVAREREARESMMRKAFLLDPFVDLRVLGLAGRLRHADREAARHLAEGHYGLWYLATRLMYGFWLQRVRVVDSLPPGLIFEHGLAAAHAGDLTAAIRDFAALVRRSVAEERSDSLMPVPLRTTQLRYMLAALSQRAGRRATAMFIYEEVLEADAGNYMAYVQLARLHEAKQEWHEAVQARQHAVVVNPEDPSLVRDLGITLSRAQRYAHAETTLVRARALSPRDPMTHYELGLVQLFLGKQAEGRASLTTFLQLAPTRFAAAIADARQLLGLP